RGTAAGMMGSRASLKFIDKEDIEKIWNWAERGNSNGEDITGSNQSMADQGSDSCRGCALFSPGITPSVAVCMGLAAVVDFTDHIRLLPVWQYIPDMAVSCTEI